MGKTLEILALSTLLLCPLFGGVKAKAQDIEPKQVIELKADESIKKPTIELILNCGIESQEKPADYSTTRTNYGITDIPDDSSYQDLITRATSLSEHDKLILASEISTLLALYSYDTNLEQNEVISQDNFFYNLQNSLPVGVCRHIATHIERFLNDIGIKSAAVSGISGNGIGHVYDISKIENGTAIIDYNRILITNTKNIEKTLQAYQKDLGITTFRHLFFEDAEFEYRLITNDGRNFLDFIEYDESSNPLKNSLIQNFKPQSDLTMTLNLEDYLTSLGINYKGLFLKAGQIIGNNSSPMKGTCIIQGGFKRKFSIPNIININPDLSFILGGIFQDRQFNDNRISGVNGNLIISTNKQKGFNLTSRIAGNISGTKDSTLFSDYIFGGGISYNIPIKNANIEPYAVSQFSFLPKDIGTYKFIPKPTELVTGIALDSQFNNSNFSIEPYYIKRKWEQGFGGKAKLGIKSVGINAEGQITKSNYAFCPHKYNFSIGPYLKLGNLEVKANYQREGTNYDGKKDYQASLNINGSMNF